MLTHLRSSLRLLLLTVLSPACAVDYVEDVGSTASAQTDPSDPRWDCYDAEPGHPTASEQARFFDDTSPAAQEAERTYGVPAAAILAMASVEGGYGFTRTAQYANNLFGYKYSGPASAEYRAPYTLSCQPAWDVGNRYIAFRDRRDGILFVAKKLATRADWANYKAATDRYRAARAAGTDAATAANAWVDGIADAGYNYDPPTYKRTIKGRMASRDLYHYSAAVAPGGAPAASSTWIAIDAPASGTTSGDVPVRVTVGGGEVTHVRFYSVSAAGADYLIGDDDAAPFALSWATKPWVPNGTYTLRIEAWRGATKVATAQRTVDVRN